MVGLNAWPEREGETPLDDLSGLRLRLAHPTRAQVSRAEADNIRQAAGKYLRGNVTEKKAPFDLPWIKKLHGEMFGDVWAWAGQFRATNKSIGVDKLQVQMQLLQLLDDLRAWPGMGIDVAEQAVRLHHRAVLIHPFENGNGRWARMLCNIWLRRNGSAMLHWPVSVDETSPIRGDYLAALRAADGMDYAPLRALHALYRQI